MWHRAYVRSHPLGLAVAVGIMLSGAIGLLFPESVQESAPALVLPDALLVSFNVVWAVGGGLASFGLIRGSRDAEVPGLALIAGGLSAYYIVVVSIRPTAALQALFIGALAIGCAVRAWHLVRAGYDTDGTHR